MNTVGNMDKETLTISSEKKDDVSDIQSNVVSTSLSNAARLQEPKAITLKGVDICIFQQKDNVQQGWKSTGAGVGGSLWPCSLFLSRS